MALCGVHLTGGRARAGRGDGPPGRLRASGARPANMRAEPGGAKGRAGATSPVSRSGVCRRWGAAVVSTAASIRARSIPSPGHAVTLLVAILAILAGLALLWGGGEILVRGAVSLARLAGLTTAVIGLTVVAMGTSLPELTVSLLAAVRGQPDISVGNVVGSNLFNIVVILGVAALVRPLPVHGTAAKVDWPIVVFSSALFVVLIRDGSIDRPEGVLLSIGLVAFVMFSVWLARREMKAEEARELAEEVAELTPPGSWRDIGTALTLLVAGLGAMVLGGNVLVNGSVSLARLAGVTERVIGLTIVAAGTSAPELAASIVAARKGHADLAIGNLLGSSVFNLLGILGVTAIVHPIAVSPEIIHSDAWWMLGSAVALFPLMRTGRKISRLDGTLMLIAYAVYLTLLLR